MEVDERCFHPCNTTQLSTHDLTWRSTVCTSAQWLVPEHLSTHDLTWRSTCAPPWPVFDGCDFQLTTSHGGRRCMHSRKEMGNKDFQLTTSHGGRQACRDMAQGIEPFNSRPHMEVDKQDVPLYPWLLTFNSRPHLEVDYNFSDMIMSDRGLSTHDLTWRSKFC